MTNEYHLITAAEGRLVLYTHDEKPPVLSMERRDEDDWEHVRTLAKGSREYELFLRLIAAGHGVSVPELRDEDSRD